MSLSSLLQFGGIYNTITGTDTNGKDVLAMLKHVSQHCSDDEHEIFTMAENEQSETLLLACYEMSMLECARYIVKRCKKAASMCDEFGYYPLHWEVGYGTPEDVEVVLEAYPDAINEKINEEIEEYNFEAGTPLELSLIDGKPGVPTFLVEHGAEITDAAVELLKEICEGHYRADSVECRKECAELLKRVPASTL